MLGKKQIIVIATLYCDGNLNPGGIGQMWGKENEALTIALTPEVAMRL